MILKIPKVFLKTVFEYLYYSIVSDCRIWDEVHSVIIEPIFFLKVNDMNIVDWKFINEWIDNKFDIHKLRQFTKNGLSIADWSELEQVLVPISKNIFELYDNPLIYPYERFAKIVYDVLPKNLNLSNNIDGICHFHSIDDTKHSKQDYITMKDFAKVMKIYNKDFIISLVIAMGNIENYIEKAEKTKSLFVSHMMNNLMNISLTAEIFYPGNNHRLIDVSII